MNRQRRPLRWLAFALPVVQATALFAQLSITTTGSNFTINFDGTVTNVENGVYAGTGFEPGAPPTAGRLSSDAWAATGWSDGNLAFGGTSTTGDFARGAHSGTGVTTGGFYAFNGTGLTSVAFGVQPGGSDWAPGTLTLKAVNNTGGAITALAVSYNVYIRNDQGRSNSFNFSWSTDNVTYNPVSALDLTSAAAATGTTWSAANARNTNITGLNLPAGGNIYLRWSGADAGGSGSRDEFALDDIVLNATGAAVPNTVVQFTSASGTVSEGAGSTNLTLSITNASTTQATTVDVAITGGSAARVNNYTTQTVTFPANTTGNQTLPITITDDMVYDGGGTVTFSLQNLAGGQGTPTAGSPSSYALTITDNEPAPLVLNEVDYDMPGANDSLEFVEIKNISAVAVDLAGFKIELVNGNGGGAAVYGTVTLPSFSLPAGGYYVVGNNATIPNINLVTGTSTNWIQNGSPDAIGLRDPGNVLIDAVSYEGNTGAPYTEGTGIAIANSDDATPGIGISRFPDGSDSNDNSVDWGRHCLTPGAANSASNTNCVCTPPEATAMAQCIDDNSWEIVVDVTSTGSGSTVNITNDQTASSALGVGVGQYHIGPFANNIGVNITVAHETFSLCNVLLSGFFDNCMPDCNNVVGGPDIPGAPCDDGDPNTVNDVWSPSCVCAGSPIVPEVSFAVPGGVANEFDVVATVGVTMDIAPSSPVTVDVTDLFTGSATSGVDYDAIGTQTFTFLPTDIYPSTQTFNIFITDDGAYEPNETVNLSLAVTSGTAGTTINTFTLTILSDDAAPLRLNEVDYDNAGTDNAEWIELKNNGATPIDLNGFKVLLVNGNGGGAAVYNTITLPSFNLPGGGYYVIGNNASIPNLDLLITPASDAIQNGSPDAIGLRDPSNNLLDAVSYEGNTGAPYTEGTGIPLANSDDNVTPQKVIARYLDGNDTDDNSVDWRAWCATPGASNATVDADSDGIADCLDNCPNLAGVQGDACDDGDPCTINDVITAGCVCAGTFQDTDGDGVCDATDNCPTLFGQQGDACDDGDACTINDVITAGCVCAGTFQDTDNDGICDALDNCPNLPGQQGDACDDGDICTINDVITNACVCAGTFQDADNDGICDANDDCPGTPGTVGSACNDNNPFTTGDVLDATCACVGTPVPCDNWTLTFTQDGTASDDSWQIVDANSPFVLATGGPYVANSTNVATVCVPQGACFNLVVTDASNNGMSNGGWVLRAQNGARVIDNEGNGGCFTTTSTSVTFCSPVGTDKLIYSDCDRENLTADGNVFAQANGAVSAQWGVGDQTDDGYQFWFFNPCGGYSRKIFRSHATSGGFGPADALRATKLAFATIVTDPLPQETLLNVRVRSRVNGVDSPWGPVCRMRISPNSCTLTRLNDIPGDPHNTCGATGKHVNASGDAGKLYALVVYQGATPANRYRFELSVPGEGYLRTIAGNTAVLQLSPWATSPLLCGTYTYNVRVAASFDGGANYCPYGTMCTVQITNDLATPYCTPVAGSLVQQQQRGTASDDGLFSMWPNPNNGRQLFITMNGLSTPQGMATVDIFDLFGKRVLGTTIPVADGAFNTAMDLNDELASGLYFVNITTGTQVRTERLVIQR